ncbi:MAG: thiosulfate oxidation carrier protein SoxY [Pseudomonadota bacterium]
MQRRTLLKFGLAKIVAGSLVFPGVSYGAYPSTVFRAKEAKDALTELFGTTDIAENDQILVETPGVARDRKMVQVKVRSTLAETESIALVVEGNETPFTAFFKIYEPQAFVTTRIRVEDSGELLVVVKADGQLFTRRHPLRIGDNMCRA